VRLVRRDSYGEAVSRKHKRGRSDTAGSYLAGRQERNRALELLRKQKPAARPRSRSAPARPAPPACRRRRSPIRRRRRTASSATNATSSLRRMRASRSPAISCRPAGASCGSRRPERKHTNFRSRFAWRRQFGAAGFEWRNAPSLQTSAGARGIGLPLTLLTALTNPTP